MSMHKATAVGERLYFDAAGPFHETASGSKYLFCCVDEHTRKGWVKFGPKKNGMVGFAKEIILELRGLNFPVTILRCDNAGENANPLRLLCLEHGVRLEFTAPNTPQMNGIVERRIAVLIVRANASMMAAGINEEGRKKLWAEAVNYHNDTENVTLSTVRREPAESALYRPSEKLFRHLQPFGRTGIVTIRRKFSGKWKERGIKMIMVGYARGHPPDTYRMYHLDNPTRYMNHAMYNSSRFLALIRKMGSASLRKTTKSVDYLRDLMKAQLQTPRSINMNKHMTNTMM